MSDDPARARFAAIQLVRIAGVAGVVLGILAASRRTLLPPQAGYVLIAAGLVATFVLPAMLIRKWRTPPE